MTQAAMEKFVLSRLITSIGLLLSALMTTEARAQSSTPWNEHPNAKVRLLAGEGRMLGIEMQLAPGWKTYWRMPGDAGVPPSFEWAGSENIKAFDVLYPAPQTMSDQGGIAIGYKDTVILPVKITLGTEGQPATAVLEFAFGVCKDICIPVESKFKLSLEGAAPWAQNAALKTHLMRVPKVAADVASAAPLITSVTREAVGGKPVLKVGTRDVSDVYVEAPDGLFIPLTQKRGGGLFEVDLSASPDLKDLIGKTVRITATTANGGVETSYVLK
jgi:DsbC/DsbD-like thiol-disulfide interchange protein